MKKNLFLMLGLGAMLLTSCDQDIVNEIYLPGGGGSVVVTDSTSTKQLQVFVTVTSRRRLHALQLLEQLFDLKP